MNLPTRRDLIGGFLPLLVAASGGMAGGVDVASPPVTLEYRFLPDETVAMTVSHRARTETTISGTTQSTDTATDSRKRWRVVSVDAEGRATIEHSVDHVAAIAARCGGTATTATRPRPATRRCAAASVCHSPASSSIAPGG